MKKIIAIIIITFGIGSMATAVSIEKILKNTGLKIMLPENAEVDDAIGGGDLISLGDSNMAVRERGDQKDLSTTVAKAEHDKTIAKIAESMDFGDTPLASAATASVSPAETDKIMADFLSAFTGDSDVIESAKKKYAAANLDDPDTIDAYNLEAPEILSQDESGCYSVRTKAGVSLRTWEICWQGGKIKTIKQTEMGFAGR